MLAIEFEKKINIYIYISRILSLKNFSWIHSNRFFSLQLNGIGKTLRNWFIRCLSSCFKACFVIWKTGCHSFIYLFFIKTQVIIQEGTKKTKHQYSEMFLRVWTLCQHSTEFLHTLQVQFYLANTCIQKGQSALTVSLHTAYIHIYFKREPESFNRFFVHRLPPSPPFITRQFTPSTSEATSPRPVAVSTRPVHCQIPAACVWFPSSCIC